MMTSDTRRALAILGALAQETRLAVFRLLVEHSPDGLTAGAVAAQLSLAPATLSFHLKELAHADLVVARQEGRFIWYRANIDTMNDLVGYLTNNCCASSAVCDPACVPATGTALPSLTKIAVTAVQRTPRKRSSG
jgi:ArsR family transcriptional regulator